MLNWEVVKREFDWDGSLRDLYVFETSEMEWNRFLEALRTWRYQTRFSVDGEPAKIPESAGGAFAIRTRATPLLEVNLGGVGLCCHFFTDEELELDLDPREVNGPTRFGQLTSFMRQLGQVLQRPVVLTAENYPESAIISYDPVSDQTSYHPPDEGPRHGSRNPST